MKVSDKTSVSMPIKNMIGIIAAVSMGIFAYTAPSRPGTIYVVGRFI